jgi:hypothetical protein
MPALSATTPRANSYELGMLLERQKLLYTLMQKQLSNTDPTKRMSSADAEELYFKYAEAFAQLLEPTNPWYDRLVQPVA